jgi:hypothetical protein
LNVTVLVESNWHYTNTNIINVLQKQTPHFCPFSVNLHLVNVATVEL